MSITNYKINRIVEHADERGTTTFQDVVTVAEGRVVDQIAGLPVRAHAFLGTDVSLDGELRGKFAEIGCGQVLDLGNAEYAIVFRFDLQTSRASVSRGLRIAKLEHQKKQLEDQIRAEKQGH